MKDEPIWNSYIDKLNRKTIGQNQRLVGGVLVVTGGYLLMKGMYCAIISLLPYGVSSRLMRMLEYAPQILLAILLLYCGTRCLRNTEILSKFLEKLIVLLPRQKQQEQMQSKPNVVYYMEKGEKMVEKSEREILEGAGREQLLRKAKELLDDDIYKSIQIEAATTIEKAPEIEAATTIEKAPTIDSVEVEKCPDLF